MEFNHISVLLHECIENLEIKKDGIYVDGTMGGAGHSKYICENLDGGRLICIDQDNNAHIKGREVLKEHLSKVTFIKDNFSNIKNILEGLEIDKIDGILLDLGVSSHQLDEGDRGFSYNYDARLDMRMNVEQKISAYDVINNYSEKELYRVIKEYGEENWAKRIAEFIVNERMDKPIETTFELVSIIKKAVPKGARSDGPHPAKRTFQAIRIEVNNELNILKDTVNDVTEKLNKDGKICIITFHSLEDRIIKNAFRNLEDPCTCPREFPMCVCGKKSKLKVMTRKPILPTSEEIEANKRSRSAKLRVAKRV